MDARSEPTRRGLSQRIGVLVDGFETVIYAIAFALLVAAAVLVVIGGAEAVVQAATHKVNTLQGGVLVLDRVLIGLIACVRRILIVTAASEQVHSDKELDRLLFELGALGLLIIGIAAAIFMIRYSSRRAAPTHREEG
jgi:hypothetical protein